MLATSHPRQSLALVLATKINRKKNQTNW